jgi:hypothetical protein
VQVVKTNKKTNIMKRNIIINSSRTALIITDNLKSGIDLVAFDSAINEEIFAFDTSLHICYCIIKDTVSGCKVIENSVPLLQFRSFAKSISNNPKEIYNALIQSLIKL